MKVTASPKKVVCPVCGWLGKPVPKERGNTGVNRGMSLQITKEVKPKPQKS